MLMGVCVWGRGGDSGAIERLGATLKVVAMHSPNSLLFLFYSDAWGEGGEEREKNLASKSAG